MRAHEIPGNRLNYLKMLQAVSKPDLDPREIENAIIIKGKLHCVIACCGI